MESGGILGRFGNHDRGDKTRASTRGDRSNGRGHAHRPLQIVPRRWCLKKNHGGRKPIFSACSIGQPSQKPSKQAQKTEDTLETSVAASPLLFRTWRLRASSTHPRHPESDSSLSFETKKKKRLAAARTRQCKPSLSSAPVAVYRLDVV